jgi:hypothetical protein
MLGRPGRMDSNSITDETTQTEQLHSDEQALHKPTKLTQIRERSTQTRSNFIGRQLTPTIYLNTEESRTPWNKFTTVQSLLGLCSFVCYGITVVCLRLSTCVTVTNGFIPFLLISMQ